MRTRSAGVATRPDSPDDDDAPEEMSLATGHEAAKEQLEGERGAVAEQRRAAKERRRRRAAQGEGEAAGPAGGVQAGDQPAEAESRVAGGAAGLGAADELDLLPAHVVAALAKARRERAAAPPGADAHEAGAPEPARQRKKPRGERRRVGPVTIEVLGASTAPSASEAAAEFARQRLVGPARSKEMLAPRQAGGARVFAPARAFAGA